MSTAIEWTHIPGYASDVWNPTTGCTSNGTGCDLCYARTLTNMRHKAYKAGKLQKMPHYAHPFNVVQQHPGRLANPLKVKRPTCYFVNSMSDLFHEEVPFTFVDQVFAVMAMCPQHIFIILTKRPERMAEYTAGERIENGERCTSAGIVRDHLGDRSHRYMPHMDGKLLSLSTNHEQRMAMRWPLPNVWMGASASTQAEVNHALLWTLSTNSAVRLLSLEPLVEQVTFGTAYYNIPNFPGIDGWSDGIDWVIVGGESGTTKQKPRPMHPDWARQVRDECKAAGVAFFFKQWGAWLPINQPWKEDDIAPKAANERWWNRAGGEGFHGEEVWRMRRASKHANGHLLDGKEEFAWPIAHASVTASGALAAKQSSARGRARAVDRFAVGQARDDGMGMGRDDVKESAR